MIRHSFLVLLASCLFLVGTGVACPSARAAAPHAVSSTTSPPTSSTARLAHLEALLPVMRLIERGYRVIRRAALEVDRHLAAASRDATHARAIFAMAQHALRHAVATEGRRPPDRLLSKALQDDLAGTTLFFQACRDRNQRDATRASMLLDQGSRYFNRALAGLQALAKG